MRPYFYSSLAGIVCLTLAACASGSGGGSSSGGGGIPPTDPTEGFTYGTPGALLANTARGATSIGDTDATVYAPGMRFPIETGPAYANSQVWGYGGGGSDVFGAIYPPAKGGSESDPRNFAYPWVDNFCETRSWTNGRCPADGKGHQGQDIRPATCENGKYYAVATENGHIGMVGTVSMELVSDTGKVYRYLHLNRPLEPGIFEGASVTRGQRLGTISDVSGTNGDGTLNRSTTLHLHFEIWEGNADGSRNLGVGPLPPYTSLVESYIDLITANPGMVDPLPAAGNCQF
ncbi:MAG: M23 family metallopeptidase [bacterium]